MRAMEKKALAKKIETLPLFAGMSSEMVDELVKLFNGFVRHYPKSDYIYLAGDCIDSLCVLVSGSVQMILEDFWGAKTVIDGLEPGYVFTEKYFGTSGNESMVSYLVASDSEILIMPKARETMQEDLGNFPLGQLVYNMIDTIADNNTRLIEKNAIICQKSLRDKIIAYLLLQARENNSNTFTIPFNRTDFASYLDSDRSSLTRELTRMKNEKIIDYQKNTFVILNSLEEKK